MSVTLLTLTLGVLHQGEHQYHWRALSSPTRKILRRPKRQCCSHRHWSHTRRRWTDWSIRTLHHCWCYHRFSIHHHLEPRFYFRYATPQCFGTGRTNIVSAECSVQPYPSPFALSQLYYQQFIETTYLNSHLVDHIINKTASGTNEAWVDRFLQIPVRITLSDSFSSTTADYSELETFVPNGILVHL